MHRIVLVLTDPPLPFGTAAGRWYYVLLRGLVARGHAVTAFGVCTRPEQAAQARELFPAPAYDLRIYAPPRRRGVLAKLQTLGRPFSYLFGPDLRQDLQAELARGFDVLHLEQHWSGWVGLEHADRALVHVLNLYEIDLADAPVRSVRERFRRRAVFRAERWLLRRFPTIVTLTPRLTERVRRISPEAAVHTIPLGIDASLYPFDPRTGTPHAPVVGLIGSFDWQPSYAAGVRLLGRLWPEIRRRLPEARLHIVGRRARAAFADLAGGLDVVLHEDVPDILPHFRALDVLLYAPGRASGMKVKVLEAFALGVPVVTTAEGVEGLPAEDGVHAGLCEDDAGLIDRTVALLRDRRRAERQCRAARTLLEDHCGPRPVLDRLERVYDAIAAGSGGAVARD
jgi:glycosyltransferase involved in cell wall biosynthesis